MFQVSFLGKRKFLKWIFPPRKLFMVGSQNWQLWESDRSRTGQRKKMDYGAVSTKTLAHCTRGSGATWPCSILSNWGKGVRPLEPSNYSHWLQTTHRQGSDLGRGKSLQPQFCWVKDNCWSWGQVVSAGSGQPSVPPVAGEQ